MITYLVVFDFFFIIRDWGDVVVCNLVSCVVFDRCYCFSRIFYQIVYFVSTAFYSSVLWSCFNFLINIDTKRFRQIYKYCNMQWINDHHHKSPLKPSPPPLMYQFLTFRVFENCLYYYPFRLWLLSLSFTHHNNKIPISYARVCDTGNSCFGVCVFGVCV